MAAMRGLVRLTGRLASALALLGLIAGIPAGLWHFVGWPLPRTVPTTWDGWARVLTSSFPDEAVINLLAVALWIVWAAFAYSVMVELAAARRGRVAPRRRLISPMQALAALLIAGMSAGPAGAIAATPPAPVNPAVAPHIPAAGVTTAADIIAAGGRLILTPAGRQPTATAVAGPPAPPATAAQLPATLTQRDVPRLAAAGFDGILTVQAGEQRYTVTVRRHDTLWDIAEAWLGDPRRWPEIYQLNRDRYDHHGRMKHGNHIEPGWVLILPVDAQPSAGAQPAPPASPTPPNTCPPTGPTAPPSSPPTTPTPSPRGSADDDGVVVPAPSAPASPIPSATATAAPSPNGDSASPTPAPASPGNHHDRDRNGGLGIELPGGWVAVPVAVAVAAAATLVWIQRRRRYRPRPPNGARRDDPDLTPPPRTVAALHRARPAPTPVPNTDDAPADLPVEAREALTVTQTALGTHADRLLRLPDLPALGVGLVGPAAHHAARGVLAAVLSSGGPWAADDEATLITTRADLATLLSEQAPDQYQMPRLYTAADLDDALAYLERQLLRRARLAAEQCDGDLIVPGQDLDQPLPPIVLLTHAPTDRSATRLAAILAVGSRLAITGVLLGAWATGTTWHVHADGRTRPDPDTTGTSGLRLNVLDTAATIDILDILRQARPDHDDLPPPISGPSASRSVVSRPHPPPGQPDTASPAPRPTSAPTPPVAAGTPSGTRLHLRVLGKPTIQLIDGQTRTDIRIRRSDGVQILVHLAVHAGGATSDELTAALWPELRRHATGRHSAGGRFYTTVSELRQTLDDALGAEAIPRADDKYRLDPQHIDVDLWQLNTAVDQAATAVDPDAHTRALREVIARYTGHLADGHSWLWLAPHREATRRHVLDAYTHLADLEPHPRAALALIQDAIRLDPYGEDLYQRAIRLHAALGSAEGVHRSLRALTERLAQLDIDVSPETQQITANLLTQLDVRHRQHSHAAAHPTQGTPPAAGHEAANRT